MNLNDSSNIIIQTEDGFEFFGNINHSVIIGDSAASGSADIASSVVIGSGAGKQCFVDSTFATRNVMIGVEAGLSASGDNGDFGYNSTFIGAFAGKSSWNNKEVVFINGGVNAKESDYAIAIGKQSAQVAAECDKSVSIGFSAGLSSSGNTNAVNIGTNAGLGVDSSRNIIAIGNSGCICSQFLPQFSKHW